MCAGTTDKNAKIVRFFCRHLVSLFIVYRPKNSTEADKSHHFLACSGTLIEIHGQVFYLTAGHVLKKIEEQLWGNQNVEIPAVRLVDNFGLGPGHLSIPFDLAGTPLFYIDDEADGLDFGVIHLRSYYVRLLAKGGVIALDEQRWRYQHRVEFQRYEILGLPAESTSGCLSSSGVGLVTPTMFPVRRLEALPEDAKETTYQRFVGQIVPELPIDSIEGMSGGPIFGFRYKDSELRYWVVALQSSWYRSRRIIFGCPLPILASLLSDWIGDALSAQRRTKLKRRAERVGSEQSILKRNRLKRRPPRCRN